MKSITFITGNPSKAKELEYYLHIPISHHALDLIEIQSINPREIIEYKTKEAYRLLETPVLVEDTSLCFHALNALPGTFIKWFLQELGTKGLCRLLDGYEDRTATAHTIYGLYDGKELVTFEGKAEGYIAKEPKGEGFGWNSIFIPEGYTQTWGEMNQEEKDKTSMRKIALNKLEKSLIR